MNLNSMRTFAVLTPVYFAIGFLSSFNDTLTPFFKNYLQLDYTQSSLISFAFFIAYLLASLPIAKLALKLGFKSSIIAGVLVTAFGSLLFTLAAKDAHFIFFLIALFVTATGVVMMLLTVMPYMSLLGPSKTTSSRMSFMQGFHSVGAVVAPLVGSAVLLKGIANNTTKGGLPLHSSVANHINNTYIVIALILMIIASIISFRPLPNFNVHDTAKKANKNILNHLLAFSFLALFVYVGAEVTIGNFMINDFETTTHGALTASAAATFVSLYWLGLLVGRFIGSFFLKMITPPVVLMFCTIAAAALVLVSIYTHNMVSNWALIAVGLCNGLMFPTIFSFGLASLNHEKLVSSGILCISITGGAIIPLIQGKMADLFGIQHSYLVPFCCYLLLFIYCIYMIKTFSTIVETRVKEIH